MKIEILSNEMINKIAAGEVVERPSSVIKELVENSIDASSTKIIIEIIEGGKEYIRVTDNGNGIERDYIKTAFMRHATSKIKNFDDLENILTLGFRGEALSSISSVAHVELTTRTKEDNLGYNIKVHGGEVIEEKEIACNTGTTMVVENLFYNVPARLKFLKKTTTESNKITDIVTRFALCNPHIAFKYINNNTTMIETFGNNKADENIYNIYGREIGKSLLKAEYSNDYCSIDGYICKGEQYRSNRNYENFFINGRYIKSFVMGKAVEDAYKEFLPIGKFPIFVLHLNINPTLVDVNVHPTKLEVRFSNEDKIYECIYTAVKNALKGAMLIPNKKLTKDKDIFKKDDFEVNNIFDKPLVEHITIEDNPKNITFNDSYDASKSISSMVYENATQKDTVIEPVNEIKREATIMPQNQEEKLQEKINIDIKEVAKIEKLPFFNSYKIIGQIFATYWIMESNNKLYIIDQHAAHERILFEEFKEKFENTEVLSQQILEPIVVSLDEEESVLLEANMSLFNKFGFELETFGKNTFAIRALPFVFDERSNKKDLFFDILENIKSNEQNMDNITDAFRDKIISMSCKAAIKAHDKISNQETERIIQDLMKLENPFTCPHGRPTIIEISLFEIEKLFKRAGV